MNNQEHKVETSTESPIVGKAVLASIHQYEVIHEQVRNYLYPKLYKLYNDKKLNKGDLPKHKTAKESVTIREFSSCDEKISVQIDIWWGSDCYDNETLTLTCDEWDAIEN